MTRDAEHTPSPQSVVVPVSAIVGFDVEEYVGGYEFRGGEGGYMPTDKERELITDAIHGVMSELSCLSAPAPSSLAGGEVREIIETLEALTKEPGQDEFDRGARAARLDALDMIRPLAALSPEAPARDDDLLPEGAISGTDDGQTVWLESHTGGAHELGVWGGLSLRFEEADGSHSIRNYVDAALTPRHEAPAEGAGEIASAARALLDACYKADENSDLSDFVDGTLLTRLDKALRARSSAPEAREGEVVAWPENDPVYVSAMRVLKGTTGWDERARDLTARMIAKNTHPAAPSADKLRIALVQAERQRDEAVGLLRMVRYPSGLVDRIAKFLANQGADQ